MILICSMESVDLFNLYSSESLENRFLFDILFFFNFINLTKSYSSYNLNVKNKKVL